MEQKALSSLKYSSADEPLASQARRPNKPVAGDLGRRAGKLVVKPQAWLRPPSQAPEPGSLEFFA